MTDLHHVLRLAFLFYIEQLLLGLATFFMWLHTAAIS
jgi:hypothetical protein